MKKIKKNLLKCNEINSPDLWERITKEIDGQEREELIVAKYKKEQKKISFKKIIAICACLTLICSIPVAAIQVKNHFNVLYNNAEQLNDDIINCAYTDQNEHLKLCVEQILYDKITCYAIISYTALDNIGQEVINYYSDNPLQMEIEPKFKDNNYELNGVNYSYSKYAKLLDSDSTKETQYFIISFQASGDNYGTDSIVFRYLLPETIDDLVNFNKRYTNVSLYEANKYEVNKYQDSKICNSTELSISNGIKFKTYSIDGKLDTGKKYIPKLVKLSPLTISIYGTDLQTNNTPVYDRIDDIYVIFNDGTKLDISGGWQLSPVNNNNNNDDIDLMICTFNFFDMGNYYYNREFTPQDIIQTDDINGIEIDGVYYELK